MEIVVLVKVIRMLVLLLLQVLGLMLVPMVSVAVVIMRSKLMHPITGAMCRTMISLVTIARSTTKVFLGGAVCMLFKSLLQAAKPREA